MSDFGCGNRSNERMKMKFDLLIIHYDYGFCVQTVEHIKIRRPACLDIGNAVFTTTILISNKITRQTSY